MFLVFSSSLNPTNFGIFAKCFLVLDERVVFVLPSVFTERSRKMMFLRACSLSLLTLGLATSCKFGAKQESTVAQEAKLAVRDATVSFDPRFAKGLASTNISRMLFDGLTYIDEHGKIFPGVATNIHVSTDLKSYTFVLRDATWSNGESVKAHDFEYSWKSALNPKNKSPYAYMFFPIQGAKSYYEGKAQAEDVGIHAMDDKTLVVVLDKPSPYFLQLTSTTAYLPVNQKSTESAVISNGPFIVSSYTPGQKLEISKNPKYWSQAAVKLSKINVVFKDDKEALEAFEKGEIDWVGSPFTSLGKESISRLQLLGKVDFTGASGTQFVRLNISKEPFANLKFRKALMLALDTETLVTSVLQGHQKASHGFVPPGMGLQDKTALLPHNVDQARIMLEEALVEMKMTRNDLQDLALSFVNNDNMQKIADALSKSWKAALDLDIKLNSQEPEQFYAALVAEKYSLAMGSWFADYFDPMSFLSVFQSSKNGVNCTGWQNADYTRLLDESNLELNPTKRMAILSQAQDILLNDLPILPLFTFTFTFAKSNELQKAALTPMGIVDLEDAYITQSPTK